MPVIRVSCLPEMPPDQLRKLHQDIEDAVLSIKELGLRDGTQVTHLFPPDMLSDGLGEEVIIEVIGLFDKPQRTKAVRQALAEALGKAVEAHFPKARIECFIFPFSPAQGFWTNR